MDFDPSKPFENAADDVTPNATLDTSKPFENVSNDVTPKPEDKHGLFSNPVPFLKAQASGLVSALKSAGSGLVTAAENPVQTASDVADSVAGIDSEGLYRSVRNTPLIGQPINDLNVSLQKDPTAYLQEQNKADALHEQQHPLTDFIQKNIGLTAMGLAGVLPASKIAQLGVFAVDAFQRSLGQNNNVSTALEDARNATLLGGAMLTAGDTISKIPTSIGKYAAKEAGVSPEAIARYRENPEAVNNAAQYADNPESLKNLVDDTVAPVNQAVDEAQTGVDTAKQSVLDTKTPPLDLASEIPDSLDSMGDQLHQMSSDAFDTLTDEGHTFPASDLSGAIDKQMDSLKIGDTVPSIGPDAAAYSAMDKFKEMVDQIGQNSEGGQIPAPVVKQLIQQLDGVSKDAYTQNAGGITPAAAKNMATIRGSFDSMLKDASPAYADQMSQLAPKVGVVSDLSKVFGNETKATMALNAAANPTSPRGIQVRNMLQNYDDLNGTDFAQRVSDYYDQPKANLASAQDVLSQAQDAASNVNKLGPNSTENTIKALQGGRNIEARKQLEALNPELAQAVQDSAVAKQFSKNTTNGSRKAVIGSGIGGALGAGAGALLGGPSGAVIGGFAGKAVGGFAGGLADVYGGQAVKSALDAGIKLDKLANTPYIRPLMAAAKQSPKSLAITHFMLSQTDPKYQQLTSGN